MVISVNAPSKKYEVVLGNGVLPALNDKIAGLMPEARIAVLTDDLVDSLHGERLGKLLAEAKTDYVKFVIPNGEASKTPQTLFSFLEFMAENGITRRDAVLAFGGGVVGDIAGFAASVYQRGIRLIQVPTTLLAMVDSSVGGKTAVDLKAGKNLAGSFYQPDAVICDTGFTKTLPADVFRDGCAEVIKYGVILDGGLYERLSGGIGSCLEYAVARCVELKRDIVEADERDGGVRGLLNFGHTFGHAAEKLSGYRVSHGAAVAKGMVIASRVAAELGISDITDELSALLLSYGFDLSYPYSAKMCAEAVSADKKRAGNSLTLILPEKPGKAILYKTTLDETEKLLEKIGL